MSNVRVLIVPFSLLQSSSLSSVWTNLGQWLILGAAPKCLPAARPLSNQTTFLVSLISSAVHSSHRIPPCTDFFPQSEPPGPEICHPSSTFAPPDLGHTTRERETKQPTPIQIGREPQPPLAFPFPGIS